MSQSDTMNLEDNSMLYTSQAVKTEILEPAAHSSTQSEFKINGSVLPNIRLSNLGLFGNNAVSKPDNLGSLSHIKHIFLYDGRNVVTQQRNFNDLMSFMLLRNSNDYNSEYGRYKHFNRLGYRNFYKGFDNAAAKYERKTVIKNNVNLLLDDTDVPASVDEALLSLNEHLTMLNKVPILSDKVFKQLRLVIEYDRDDLKTITTDNVAAADKPQATRPLLIVDRVHDEKVERDLLAQLKNVQWMEYEQDNFFQDGKIADPADNNASGEVVTVQKVNGFNNKNLQRIVIAKRNASNARMFNANAAIGYGPYASIFGLGHEYQVTVNGRNILPRDRIKGPNRELAMITDTWGNLNLHEDSHIQMDSDIPVLDDTTLLGKQGQQSYFGLYVGEKVQDLKIEFKRDLFADDQPYRPHNENYRLEVTGEVVKQLEVINGGYLISYA